MSKFRRNMMMWNRPVEVNIDVPTISPAAGDILSSQTISINISGTASGAEYSFDNETWTTYTTPFSLTNDTTVYARAIDGDGKHSRVVSNSYSLIQLIEYLQSTGAQWIDTGVYPTSELSFEITLQRIDTGTDDEIAFGCRNSSGAYDFSLWTNPSANKGFAAHYAYNTGSSNKDDSGWVYKDNITNAFHTVLVTPQTITVDNNICHSWSHQNRALFTCPYKLAIFCLRQQSNNDARTFKGKISSVKIWLNDSLVRDFVSVRYGQTGYMYDKVNKELLSNSGSGSFTLGNDVTT